MSHYGCSDLTGENEFRYYGQTPRVHAYSFAFIFFHSYETMFIV